MSSEVLDFISDGAVAEVVRERKEQNKVIMRHLPNISYRTILDFYILVHMIGIIDFIKQPTISSKDLALSRILFLPTTYLPWHKLFILFFLLSFYRSRANK